MSKRPATDEIPRPDSGKRHYGDTPASVVGDQIRGSPPPPRSSFPSYLDAGPELSPKARLLCEILASNPPTEVERALDSVGVRVSTEDVEAVLKFSYSQPGAAVAFFRWAGSRHLADRHSPYAWNLVVDLLGKNLHFEAMWNAVRSMRSEGLLSLATFASIFSSFCATGRPDDALAAFDTMNLHGVPRDTAALNSLLSAVCREGRVATARLFCDGSRSSVAPDADSFAILLEGCENDVDHRSAREVFDDMIATVGWDPANVQAYDSFLTILVRSGSYGFAEALRFFEKMKQKRCFPGMKFFRDAIEVLVKKKDAHEAMNIWEELMGRNGCFADTPMYNSMIALQCDLNQIDVALRFFDEMIIYGAFPDSQTYNVLIQFLLKGKKLREAASLFNEMVKNECCPTAANCASLMKTLMDSADFDMALKVWKCMTDNGLPPLEEAGNMLVLALRDVDMLPEACKYAEDMIDRGIKLNSSTLSKLRQSLLKIEAGDDHAFDMVVMEAHLFPIAW
ncbi:unnamed protein product [Musa acuminata subsp. malaccensis]|uniref:(wild Malaysian banana) hypothetical protein n=1 Tax=Musa acuminata subsp. malaccensis TaxID=214687 RepID=A0A804HQQ1_MUSAM|nr:unnamed protein product [Musa acuminata subsp. malaccensis]